MLVDMKGIDERRRWIWLPLMKNNTINYGGFTQWMFSKYTFDDGKDDIPKIFQEDCCCHGRLIGSNGDKNNPFVKEHYLVDYTVCICVYMSLK
jgi:hypothetical protein